MKKMEAQTGGTSKVTENTSQQSEEEYYNSLLHRIYRAQVLCQMASEDMQDAYRELKTYRKNILQSS